MRRPQLIGRTAEALTFGMVAFAFGVSSMALTALGVKYDEEGGSFVQKLHPATALAALALAADFASRSDRLAWLSSLPHRFPGLCYFAVTAVIAIIFAALVQGSPITPLVDTFFCGAAFLLLYSDASERFRRGTRLFLHSFMLINAIIAIAEFLTQMRLTPFVAGGHVILHDYRSTALLGHPLNNAAASAAYALLLLYGGDPSLSAAMRATLILFQIPALVAFGGRAATV
ncbi:MAG: hypothetical protein N2444_09690, partial [Methylocystis sp.]|nr:hypothetical protein [Methylocystis sp.]